MLKPQLPKLYIALVFEVFFLWSPLGNYEKKSCLNKLKFWEASRNQKRSICWKFQLSISLGRQKSPSTIQPGQQLNKPFWKKRNKTNRIKGCDVTVTFVVIVNLAWFNWNFWRKYKHFNDHRIQPISCKNKLQRQPFCLNKPGKNMYTIVLVHNYFEITNDKHLSHKIKKIG